MRKTIALLVLLLVIIAAGAGYWQFQKQARIQAEITHVTIGALVPITGHLSSIGQQMRNGMEMAKEDLIAAGTVKSLHIIYEDACSEATSWVAAKKLVEQDRVNIIASSFCIFGQDAIMPFTEANKIIIFNTAANSKELLNKKYGFSTHTTVEHEGKAVAEYAYKKMHARTAAVIHLDSSFGRGYRDGFTKEFESLGGKVLYTAPKHPLSEDFYSVLQKIKQLNPDVIFIAHFGASLGHGIKQTREMGIESKIIGEYESEDPTVIRLARDAAEGVVISYPEQMPLTATMKQFEKRYQEKYGEAPNLLAKNGYDAVMLSVTNYVHCKTNTDCIAEKLEKTKDYDGASGMISINPDHSVIKPIHFKIIQNGQFILIDHDKH